MEIAAIMKDFDAVQSMLNKFENLFPNLNTKENPKEKEWTIYNIQST